MTTDTSQPAFVALPDDEGNLRMLNISQIAWLSVPSGAESIELRMSDGNLINLNGKEVCHALLMLLSKRSVTAFGQPFGDGRYETDDLPSSSGFQTKVSRDFTTEVSDGQIPRSR